MIVDIGIILIMFIDVHVIINHLIKNVLSFFLCANNVSLLQSRVSSNLGVDLLQCHSTYASVASSPFNEIS